MTDVLCLRRRDIQHAAEELLGAVLQAVEHRLLRGLTVLAAGWGIRLPFGLGQ